MRKILLVGWREFRQRVTNRGFILSSVLIPLFFIFFWAIAGTSQPEPVELEGTQSIQQTQQVIGYVDQAELIESIPENIEPETIHQFPDIESAGHALQQQEIEVYYIIPPDYRQSGELRRVSLDLPATPPETDTINWILVSNLIPGVTPNEAARLLLPLGPGGVDFVDLTSEIETGAAGLPVLPFLVTLAILMPLFTSGGYLFQSLIQEKSNRVIEILLVSLRPSTLLGGKLIGLGFLILVQYLIWAAIMSVVLLITRQDPSGILAGIDISPNELVLIVPFALGGFILYAGIMAGIGALSSDTEGSRLWLFLISLPMLIPIYLWTAIANDPNGTLATALSLFPFSAPVAMLLRMTSAVVPRWQLIASLVLLLLTGFGVVWLMARLFRARTLLSGESFSLQRFFSALQS
jgi:ABC-2 type transport system permease protein